MTQAARTFCFVQGYQGQGENVVACIRVWGHQEEEIIQVMNEMLDTGPVESPCHHVHKFGCRALPKWQGSVNVGLTFPGNTQQEMVTRVNGNLSVCTLKVHLNKHGAGAKGLDACHGIIYTGIGNGSQFLRDACINAMMPREGQVDNHAPFPLLVGLGYELTLTYCTQHGLQAAQDPVPS
jgi:hypothetical protein